MSYTNQAGSDRLNAFRKQIHHRIATRRLDAPVIGPDGTRPVVIVDEHDLVSEVMAQAARTGGCANLYVLRSNGKFVAASVLPSDTAIENERAESVNEPVHMDAEIGFLLEAAEKGEHGLTFQIALPSHRGAVHHTRSGELVA